VKQQDFSELSPTIMVATLRMPFRSLSSDNLIARGAAGHVFAVSDTAVFKCPTIFDNPAPCQQDESEESILQVNNEKSVYDTLMQHPHPHIVHGILCVPEGFFMQRMEMTLENRLRLSPSTSETQERWIRQLVGAVAWLEELGYVHGDLRPGNIMLDRHQNIKVGDFDATVKRGDKLLAFTEPFCKPSHDYDTLPAGPLTEQFSLGSCIYNIRFGHPPFDDLESPVRVKRMAEGDFPQTSSDEQYGGIISACWRGTYNSIGAIKLQVDQLQKNRDTDTTAMEYTGVDGIESWCLLAECRAYVALDRLDAHIGLGRLQARFYYCCQWLLHTSLGILLKARHLFRRQRKIQ
jgi:serine/threonine protein kinase